jgi:hypothetical protein
MKAYPNEWRETRVLGSGEVPDDNKITTRFSITCGRDTFSGASGTTPNPVRLHPRGRTSIRLMCLPITHLLTKFEGRILAVSPIHDVGPRKLSSDEMQLYRCSTVSKESIYRQLT